MISWRNLLRQALPIGISLIMIRIIYNIDTVMLGFMRSDVEIGYYNAAYKIILPLIMVGVVYLDAIFPVLSNYYKTSLDSFTKLQNYTTKLMVAVALPLTMGGTILAKPIMNLVYGPKYDNGVIAFQLLIWVAALIYINSIYARGLWACNKQNQFLKIITVQAVSNIGLNFILISYWGIVGAAISTISAEILAFFLYYREFNKTVSVSIGNHIIKPFLATIVLALFLIFGINLNIFFQIFGGACIYVLSLYHIKGITNEDIRLLRGSILTNTEK